MELNQIYDTVKKQIIELILPPECILSIAELSKTFGISRTPVKEVLIRLAGEGWLLIQDNRFIVPSLSMERFIELTEIRIALETQAHLLAMNRMNQEERKALLKIRDKVQKLENSSSNESKHVDWEFHRFLYKASKNRQLHIMLEQLLMQQNRFWSAIPSNEEPNLSVSTTLEIIQGVNGKDEELIRKATHEHVRFIADLFMNHLR